MMCDQLQKDYPNTFSLPGETAIKQHTSSLFAASRKLTKTKMTMMNVIQLETHLKMKNGK